MNKMNRSSAPLIALRSSRLLQRTDTAAAATTTKSELTRNIPRLQAVTSHAAAYLQRWCEKHWSDALFSIRARTQMYVFALLLVAAGRGPARLPTCEHTLRHARTEACRLVGDTWRRCDDLASVVVHALSLLRPGELRELRVRDANVFRLVAPLLHAHPHEGARTSEASQALGPICAVELASHTRNDRGERHTAAFIERCAATLTELEGGLPGRLLCASDGAGRPPVLARCTRLEVLTRVCDYAPAVWLGLSHLHTLRDVDLGQVSVAAIAAALPRLHTLDAFGDLADDDFASVAGFLTDLLPRLWVFHFWGSWPAERAVAVAPTAPLPLPLLQELLWHEHSLQPTVLRGFLGARPIVLHVPYALIAECLPRERASSLLARVCELHVCDSAAPLDVSDVAGVLRAAPQLRHFQIDKLSGIDWPWLAATAGAPKLAGLVHPRLRCFCARDAWPFPSSSDGRWVWQLRRSCFPRLRAMEINRVTFSVTADAGNEF
jgi:hypothetical protein